MSETEEIRVDIWLWRARFFKTRSLAARFLMGTRVRITRNGQTQRVTRSARLVRPGDRLSLPLRSGLRQIEILAIGERRGPPAEAQALYADMAMGVGESTCSTSSNPG